MPGQVEPGKFIRDGQLLHALVQLRVLDGQAQLAGQDLQDPDLVLRDFLLAEHVVHHQDAGHIGAGAQRDVPDGLPVHLPPGGAAIPQKRVHQGVDPGPNGVDLLGDVHGPLEDGVPQLPPQGLLLGVHQIDLYPVEPQVLHDPLGHVLQQFFKAQGLVNEYADFVEGAQLVVPGPFLNHQMDAPDGQPQGPGHLPQKLLFPGGERTPLPPAVQAQDAQHLGEGDQGDESRVLGRPNREEILSPLQEPPQGGMGREGHLFLAVQEFPLAHDLDGPEHLGVRVQEEEGPHVETDRPVDEMKRLLHHAVQLRHHLPPLANAQNAQVAVFQTQGRGPHFSRESASHRGTGYSCFPGPTRARIPAASGRCTPSSRSF